MTHATTDKLYVNLSASQTRKRLKRHGFGVRRVEAVDRNQAVIVHTATGEHLRELKALFADVNDLVSCGTQLKKALVGPMNVSGRQEQIEAMLAEDPEDQFLRYSLAMECEKEGDHDQSLQLLDALTRDSEPYVAAFFMAGQQLAKLGRIQEARTYLRDGIEAAQGAGDAYAAGEMSEFLANLGALGE